MEIVDLALSPLEKTISLSQAEIKKVLREPDLELCCDRALIARAIGKLVDNAIKFSPRGVSIVVGAATLKGGDLAFLVRDAGPGMSAERLALAMQPFNQADMSFRRSKEGLGLGLPLANAIITAHGGRLKLDSAIGQGTSALLILPSARLLGTRTAVAGAA
jgi:two-component system, cell cycle sensor histidine kinase PleC